MTQRISSYLDTLWGAETVPWSMYYLNGQDNSMILISTLPLKDLSSGFKETTVGSIVDSRRAEMLQQANALDERESFSSLRRLAWQNGHYFTLRTTFNQPGHLATGLRCPRLLYPTASAYFGCCCLAPDGSCPAAYPVG